MEFKGKYFGQKRPPPGGGNKFTLPKNREEIQLNTKTKNLKTSLFFTYYAIFFPVFCRLSLIWQLYEDKNGKISALLRANCCQIPTIWIIFRSAKQGRKSRLSYFGGRKNSDFWPKYLPLMEFFVYFTLLLVQ